VSDNSIPQFDEVPVVVGDKAAVKSDAKNRAMRTFLQGLGIDLLIAIAGTAYIVLTGEGFGWAVLGTAVAKTALTTLASYVMRIKLNGKLLTSQESQPIIVNVGGYELALQRPGKADHAAGGDG
jgi:hypothetical protein